MATDRSLYLALSELSRRYADPGSASRAGTLTARELCCFSQHGEDGVIAEILGRIGVAERFFVEFGVESGREGNCVFLADVQQWDGLFIEADADHFRRLAGKYAATDRIRVANAAVTPDTVEQLFADAGVPAEPDILSIDIDGGDYWVWEAIHAHRARVVVIEYNAALPVDRPLAQPRDHAEQWNGTDFFGASLEALRLLGADKGYRLVHTELAAGNAFFVRADVAGDRFPELDSVPRWGEPNYFMQGHHHPHDPRTNAMRDPRATPPPEGDSSAPAAAQAGCILPGMAESSGANENQAGSASSGFDERDLVHRRIRAAMTAPPPPPLGPQPASPVVAQELERMRGRSDLFGFTIAPRRPVVGMRAVKRLLRRLQAQTFVHQSEFNRAATSVAQMLASEEHGARRAVHAQAAALTNAEDRIASLESRLLDLQAENRALSERRELERLAPASGGAGDADGELDYLGLQVRFRGDEEEIAERQRWYVGRFAGVSDVLDIGCGRGEFLRLLRDAEITASGVDTDADMVKLCRANGLEVVRGDGLARLAELEDESLGGIFAAQVIEHLEPARIVSMMRTARRKLRTGGVLILETVNPASVVALTNFYLDFTHIKPIHPLALRWLAESLEYADSELLYLSPVENGPRLRPLPDGVGTKEEAGEFNHAVVATNEVLYGPRDYALIARRP